MIIRNLPIDEIKQNLISFATPNGIKIPTDSTMTQVAESLKFNFGNLEPEMIRKAFNHWVVSENYIKNPHYLNSKFIADIIRFYKSQIRTNNGLETADKKMTFTHDEAEQLATENINDCRRYVQTALNTKEATFLTVKGLELADRDLLKRGEYDVEMYSEDEVNTIGAFVQDYLKDMANKAKKTSNLVVQENHNLVQGYLLTSTDVTFEAARAACHFMKKGKNE